MRQKASKQANSDKRTGKQASKAKHGKNPGAYSVVGHAWLPRVVAGCREAQVNEHL